MRSHNYIKTRKGIVDLEDLKARTDLRDIYGAQNLYCPWHDDTITPNLHIYPDHVYCFACGAVRDTVSFVMYMEKLDFRSAIEFLSSHAGSTAVKEVHNTEPVSQEEIKRLCHQLWLDDKVITYLINRGIESANLVTGLQLGYDFHSITIPHFANGNCVNIKFRNLTSNGPKYNSLPGREFRYLYPYDYFRQHFADSKVLYLTEGEFDCMLLLQECIPAMSLPAGANTPLENYIPFLKRFNRIVCLFDLDEAGNKAYERIINAKLKTGYTINDMCGSIFGRVTWNPSYGKDLTDARQQIIHLIRADYATGV